ncbi:MAG TPA: hypothetical protein VMF56_00895 [Acidobacteriaceae bacterium]|nr:hypothetical protein [Acidobacteriaceae bacterium]
MAFFGCGTREQQIPPHNPAADPSKPIKRVPPTPIDKKAAELGETTWNPAWNHIVAQALPPVLLSNRVPRDVRLFCPRFYVMTKAQKRTFWAYFFQALAGAEAGLNPDATARHTEPKLAHEEHVPVTKVRTEGLLQLTYADRQRYGCPFDEEADRGLPPDDPARTILQPKNNLICGVAILKNQLIDLHRPLLWSDSYWATLRPGTLGYRNFMRQMTNPPAACGLHMEHAEHHRPPEQDEAMDAP